MGFILTEKIFNHYSKKELGDILSPKVFTQLSTNTKILPWFSELAKVIDIKKIGYTLEDFKHDYPKYHDFIEIETVFNILSQGISLRDITLTNSNFNRVLRKGFYYNSTMLHSDEIRKYIIIHYDISDFKIEFYKNHIELYGDKEKLEEFKKKFNLNEDVFYEKYKESWHLAFKGLLAECIRIHEKKDTD